MLCNNQTASCQANCRSVNAEEHSDVHRPVWHQMNSSQLCQCCRALRQNKEAAALGLLEGQTSQPSRDSDLQASFGTQLTLVYLVH